MLGRTDSRRRMLLLLITFAVIAASLVARLAYWQVAQQQRLAQEAFEQTTMRSETNHCVRSTPRPNAPRRSSPTS